MILQGRYTHDRAGGVAHDHAKGVTTKSRGEGVRGVTRDHAGGIVLALMSSRRGYSAAACLIYTHSWGEEAPFVPAVVLSLQIKSPPTLGRSRRVRQRGG